MPELPEVESIRRGLAPALLGRRVVRAELRRRDMGRAGGGRACTGRDLLEGATVAEMVRLGKQLAIVAGDGRVLVVQLGMTGALRLVGPGEAHPASHVHAEWTIDTGSRLIFRDPRRFGRLRAFASLADLRGTHWAALGPDAAAITGAQLRRRAAGSRRAIKAALLDQGVLAGVGNIYADEALFRAAIRPARRASRLSREEFDRLAAAIRRTLALAVRAGGSTIRDYVDSAGGAGRAQLDHAVYGRAGEACVRCGGTLRGARFAQRATVYCPRCQPR